MSYSQYRQRNESGKTLPISSSLSMSSRKDSHYISEDEQSTQEGTFTGYQSRSNYQPLSSMKRNSKMGRLKTAPLPIRLATINFDEELDENNDSNIDQHDGENPPIHSASVGNVNNSGVVPTRNFASKSSALNLVASMQERQNYPRKMIKPMQQHREPLSARDNVVTTGSTYETQSSRYTTHLGKSPVKVRPIRDMENFDKKSHINFPRSPEKKFPPPVRSPTKHTSSLMRRHHIRQQTTILENPDTKHIVPEASQSSETGTSDYVSSSLYSYSTSQTNQSTDYQTVSNQSNVSPVDMEISNQLKVTSTELQGTSSSKQGSSLEKDTTDAKTDKSTVSLEKSNTEANNSISRMPRDFLSIKDKNYTLIGQIGRGGSSIVFRALDNENNQMRAIKRVDLSEIDPKQAEDFINEISHLEKLKGHERIIEIFGWERKRLRESSHNCNEEYLFVVMECGEKDLGTLLKEISKDNKGLTDNKIKFYWEEMLEAVQVIHREGIVHRDLKPGNFVIVGGRIKLIDFGIAKAMAEDKTHITINNMMGTFNFMSPEVIESSQNDSGENVVKFNHKADVWSLGCILYNMIYKKMPFGHIKEPIKKIMAICNPDHQIKLNENELANHDPTVNDVLRLCLVRDPSKRGSIEDLLEHKYLRSQSTETDNPTKPKPKKVDDLMQAFSTLSPMSKVAFLNKFKET